MQPVQNARYAPILAADARRYASKSIMEAVHNLGVNRVEVILKIDSRRDKNKKMEEKIDSIKKHLKK